MTHPASTLEVPRGFYSTAKYLRSLQIRIGLGLHPSILYSRVPMSRGAEFRLALGLGCDPVGGSLILTNWFGVS